MSSVGEIEWVEVMAANFREGFYLIHTSQLNQLLKEKGMSQSQLAKQVGILQKEMWKYVVAERVLPLDKVQKIAEVLDCEVEDIAFRRSDNASDYLSMLKDENCDDSYKLIREGITRNIRQRLSISHSPEYVNEIMANIDSLIRESIYYGVEKTQKGESDEVLEMIQKKRNVY